MSLRNEKLVSDEYYHVYNRGNGKNKIFLDKEDYDRFLKILFICNSKNSFIFRESIVKQKISAWDFERGDNLVDIGLWVLMPNHFHIMLISSSHRQGLWLKGLNPISIFMQKVSTAYVMYFNKKYGRTGSLFEGKFKAKHIDKENYLEYLFSYIHLNPIKLIEKDWKINGLKDIDKVLDFLDKFKYSSYLDYKNGDRKESKIINKEFFPDSFKKIKGNNLIKLFISYQP
jgi:putative transposase